MIAWLPKIGLALGCGATVVACGIWVGTTETALSNTAERLDAHELETKDDEHRLTVLETNYDTIISTLERIEGKLQ